jgi:hypothetical protein
MGRMCVAGHKNFGCKELEECSVEWRRMASNPEEDQGSQRDVVPVMMMMLMNKPTLRANLRLNIS